ncbi:MAG: glycoside hydrolase family 5 protein [Treponema sp.]|jgi:endoglucanase|nr:glycoside hydrolase family 5 protein [Treponema sp.]
MKRFFITRWFVLLFPGLFFSGCGNTGITEAARMSDTENEFTPEGMTGLDALSYFREQGLNIGWNLGNALDAHRGGVSGETAWGNPRITGKIFEGVKKAGYQVVRIPITWMGHIGEAPDYHIDPDFLKRTAEVAGYARDAGLKVIINLHHDGATESGGKDLGWLSINKARQSEEGMREVTAQFERVWVQIAKYFKNYGDYLMFESMNEVHDGNWGWGKEQDQKPQYEIVNQWNQVFVNAVRSTGGNNAGRFLVIPGYCTVPRHTTADYFKLPLDSAPGVNKLIVTVHYYDPYEFCIAAARHAWGSDADKRKADQDFKAIADRFITGGQVPVIIGESGAVRQEGYEAARLEYFEYVYGKAHELGLVPIYWDNGAFGSGGENFGLFNRTTGEPYSEETDGVIKAMILAVE